MFEELFDQDYIQQNYMDIERERAMAEGEARGEARGEAKGIIKSILAICDLLSPERIAERFQLSVDEVMSILRANGKVV